MVINCLFLQYLIKPTHIEVVHPPGSTFKTSQLTASKLSQYFCGVIAAPADTGIKAIQRAKGHLIKDDFMNAAFLIFVTLGFVKGQGLFGEPEQGTRWCGQGSVLRRPQSKAHSKNRPKRNHHHITKKSRNRPMRWAFVVPIGWSSHSMSAFAPPWGRSLKPPGLATWRRWPTTPHPPYH